MKERIEALISRMPEEVDAVLITGPVNRIYFTGMHSTAGTLLVLRDGSAYFLIDFRYIEKAREVVSGCEVILQQKLFAQLAELLKKHGARRVALDSGYMTLSEYLLYSERLPEAELLLDDTVDKEIRRMRMIKSPKELACIREAQRITDDAFAHICGYIRAGRTEREIACELLDFTARRGSEKPSFDYIVVSGKNTSMPHGAPSGKPVEDGDFVTMDFGCTVEGYCSDMTRTVAVRKVSERQKEVYDTVLKAQLAAMAAVRPGVTCKSVDTVARELIDAAGFQGCFGHGTGHSLGLEIHEEPAFNTVDETLCEPGMVITIEPGIYLEGKFGVRIENMVTVTEDGFEDLTGSVRELMIIH